MQRTIGAFEKIIKQVGLAIVHRELYLIRPEFRNRYGVPVLRSGLLARMPVLREITTMGAYYLLGGCCESTVDALFQDDASPRSRGVEGGR